MAWRTLGAKRSRMRRASEELQRSGVLARRRRVLAHWSRSSGERQWGRRDRLRWASLLWLDGLHHASAQRELLRSALESWRGWARSEIACRSLASRVRTEADAEKQGELDLLEKRLRADREAAEEALKARALATEDALRAEAAAAEEALRAEAASAENALRDKAAKTESSLRADAEATVKALRAELAAATEAAEATQKKLRMEAAEAARTAEAARRALLAEADEAACEAEAEQARLREEVAREARAAEAAHARLRDDAARIVEAVRREAEAARQAAETSQRRLREDAAEAARAAASTLAESEQAWQQELRELQQRSTAELSELQELHREARRSSHAASIRRSQAVVVTTLFYLWRAHAEALADRRREEREHQRAKDALEHRLSCSRHTLQALEDDLVRSQEVLRNKQMALQRRAMAGVRQQALTVLARHFLWWRAHTPAPRVTQAIMACAPTADAGCLAQARTANAGIATDEVAMRDACAVTDSRFAAREALFMAQARLRMLLAGPGLGRAFWAAVESPKPWGAAGGTAVGPAGALQEESFRHVAAALLRGHFLIAARAFALWHVWTLLWLHPPSGTAGSVSTTTTAAAASAAARSQAGGSCARSMAGSPTGGRRGAQAVAWADTAGGECSSIWPTPNSAGLGSCPSTQRAGARRYAFGGDESPPPLPGRAWQAPPLSASRSTPALSGAGGCGAGAAGPLPVLPGSGPALVGAAYGGSGCTFGGGGGSASATPRWSQVQAPQPRSPSPSRQQQQRWPTSASYSYSGRHVGGGRIGMPPSTPSTAATSCDLSSIQQALYGKGGNQHVRSVLETSSGAVAELHAEATTLRVENSALAERHWTLCAEVRSLAEGVRAQLRQAARDSVGGDQRLTLDRATQICRWILEVTDHLRSLATFALSSDFDQSSSPRKGIYGTLPAVHSHGAPRWSSSGTF
eukprot:TRINITY_DN73356_c0_g1_i1.p1 TRINITY_DN73356_c0_g1~~TRINITY_DN73356_c0_g1_i1.p1  ORF type:complete len:975 (+),score=237.03 TRINITY_DN73356_c0_g1_i1:132-2927(+)